MSEVVTVAAAKEENVIQYRKAANWQIILSQMNNASAMIFYTLAGLMSYLANEGYGIVMAAAGLILTVTRVFDGVIDPFIALIIERVNTRFGKLRLFMLIGWFVRSLAVFMLFVWGSSSNYGTFYFIFVYVIFIIGSSIYDIAGNMIPPVMTNDPKQRPLIQVWSTVYSYLVPTALSLTIALVLLPRFDNQYSVELLSAAALLFVPISLIFTILCCIGVSAVDKPENFIGVSADGSVQSVHVRDMFQLFKRNRPFQMYLVSSVSAKLAQQTTSQAIVSTLLFGILIGNIQLGTTLNIISIFPSILFAIVGAKYAGKFGNKTATVMWTWISIIISVLSVVLLLVIDTRMIPQNKILMVVFVGLLILSNGAKMCITIANGAMRSDVVDYELDQSGKFMPAVITSTYNFVDQFVTSLGATIAAGAVSLVGYTTVAPQPTDDLTSPIKYMTLILYYGIPIMGWIAGLIAMKYYKLSKEEVIDMQQRIHDKKQKILTENVSN
ncbi:MFS transporter [Enterococcus casseliflavus]|uniref:MFS transporter n=2 Tax=Enterococcus TaxID=1350 RepID=UPI0017819FD1|nr:MFS transporter [Enterococcus casseliflavus]QOG29385.1 MFS transporter [Enterococcus casseliflavus]